jgi:hypothetical protein
MTRDTFRALTLYRDIKAAFIPKARECFGCRVFREIAVDSIPIGAVGRLGVDGRERNILVLVLVMLRGSSTGEGM